MFKIMRAPKQLQKKVVLAREVRDFFSQEKIFLAGGADLQILLNDQEKIPSDWVKVGPFYHFLGLIQTNERGEDYTWYLRYDGKSWEARRSSLNEVFGEDDLIVVN